MTGEVKAAWASSLRVRLTLWNVGVLALMLCGLGLAIRYTLVATLIAGADRRLAWAAGSWERWVPDHGLTLQPWMHRPGAGPAPGPPPPGGPPPRWPLLLDAQGRTLVPDWQTRALVPDTSAAPAPYDQSGLRLALRGQRTFTTTRNSGGPARVLSAPLLQDGQVIGAVQVERPLTEAYQEIRRLTNILFVLAVPALLLAGLGGAFLTSRVLRPVREITQAASRIEAEDLSGRLAVAGRDELSQLALTFNAMLERLERAFGERAAAYAQMEQAYTRLEQANERLERANEQQRRFTADASHELKTPLTVIEGTVSLALSGERTAAQYRQSLETVGRSAGMMARIVEDLLLLARSDAGQLAVDRRVVSVSDVLSMAREALSGRDHAAIALADVDPHLSVCGDPNHLVRLFVNLLDNAARHTPADGAIRVSATGDGEHVTVTVADTGSGIAPEHLPHVFERFYRADAARARRHGGTGLGLAICQSIAEAHGGSLSIASAPGQGTQVRVRLPQVVDPAPPAAPQESRSRRTPAGVRAPENATARP